MPKRLLIMPEDLPQAMKILTQSSAHSNALSMNSTGEQSFPMKKRKSKKTETFIYLASPYSAKSPKARDKRFRKVCRKAAALMLQGYRVFCPIAHSHPIETLGMKKKHNGDFWLQQDFAVLTFCDELWVYCMKGWEDSYGIRKEIEYAQTRNIPIRYITS